MTNSEKKVTKSDKQVKTKWKKLEKVPKSDKLVKKVTKSEEKVTKSVKKWQTYLKN